MKRPSKRAVELYEEAVYLLRRAHAPAFAAYYTGSLPFVLGFLFFWADLSHSAFAYEHCAPAALGLALLFCWMMYFQSIFIRCLRAELSSEPAPAWFSAESRRLGFLQCSLQPTKFLILPVAAICMLPFARAYAFYQDLMNVGYVESLSPSRAIRAARNQAAVWPSQNWTLLAILAMLNVVVYINIAAAILIGPYLLKLLLGVETAFTRSGLAAMNTTFLAVSASLTYLVTNPLAKTVYFLRQFYANSLETGEDLRIKHLIMPALLALLSSLILVAQPAPVPAPPAISEDRLNLAINDVIHRPEFTWRLPRAPQPPEKNANWFIRTAESIVDMADGGVHRVKRWFESISKWFSDRLKSLLPGLGGNQPGPDSRKLQALLYTLLAAVAMVLGWLIRKIARSGKPGRITAAAPIAAVELDLSSDGVQADQQPLDQWLVLARDHMARQELRLALRALYLAGLAYLAGRSLISIQRSKSNQDYAQELRRKARDTPELVNVFVQNVNVFERTWYGLYEVDLGIVEQFENNLAQMRACAKKQ